jgi:hypothetical protein
MHDWRAPGILQSNRQYNNMSMSGSTAPAARANRFPSGKLLKTTRLAGVATLAVLISNVAKAQDPAAELVDECRRIAQEQYTSAAAEYDSDALKDKEIFDTWRKKTSILVAATKKANAVPGRFGDAKIFDNYPRLPSKIAAGVFTDVQTTLRAVSSTVTTLENQLSATPRDPVLYCSYATAFYHRNILQKLLRSVGVHQITLQEIENYFQVRIGVSSAISKTEYQKDRDEINETLLNLYEGEVRTAAHTQVLLKQLTKQ